MGCTSSSDDPTDPPVPTDAEFMTEMARWQSPAHWYQSPAEREEQRAFLARCLAGASADQVRDRLRRLYGTLVATLREGTTDQRVQSLEEIFRFGHSLSGAAVACQQPRGRAARGVALVLGFGGSSVNALQPYLELYGRAGMLGIAGTRPNDPMLRGLWLTRLAKALSRAAELLRPGRLVVHVCSDTGFCAWAELCALQAGRQELASPEAAEMLQALPVLAECCCGVVHDCCPTVSRKLYDSNGPSPLLTAYFDGVVTVAQTQLLKLPSSQQLQTGPNSVLHKTVHACYKQSAELRAACGEASPMNTAAWGQQLDAQYAPDVPRLFMFSKADTVCPMESIQDYIVKIENRMQSEVRRQGFERGAHMTLGLYFGAYVVGAIQRFLAQHFDGEIPDLSTHARIFLEHTINGLK